MLAKEDVLEFQESTVGFKLVEKPPIFTTFRKYYPYYAVLNFLYSLPVSLQHKRYTNLLRLLHTLLAILVLLGSAGVTVNRHFCMGELKSVAIFGEAEKCHKEQTKAHCPFHPAPQEETEGKKKGCCDDESELVQIDDQEQLTPDVSPVLTAWVADFPPLLFNYLPPHPRPRKNTNFENYRPPPLLTDACREFQVFRI